MLMRKGKRTTRFFSTYPRSEAQVGAGHRLGMCGGEMQYEGEPDRAAHGRGRNGWAAERMYSRNGH
jgi:hypothetical protein